MNPNFKGAATKDFDYFKQQEKESENITKLEQKI
jgi:hypothetical protein